MVGRISRAFNYMDIEMFKILYPSMIRSHMEYAVQAWSPHLMKDINLLEKVQKRATRLVHSLRNCTYDERLTALGLTSLKERRERGDLIEVYKIIHGFENVDRKKLFTLEKEKLNRIFRGHQWRIWKPRKNNKRRKVFFDFRVIDRWNELPLSVADKSDNRFFQKWT